MCRKPHVLPVRKDLLLVFQLLQGHVEELGFDLLACRRPQLLLGHTLLEGEPLVVEADLPEKLLLQSLVGGKRNDPGLFPVDADDGFLFGHVLQDPVQIAQRDPRPHGKPARREPLNPRAPQDHGHPLDVSPRAEQLQLHGKPLLCLFLLHGIGVEDLAAAHRADGGVAADHEPVPPHGHDGLFQQQLGVDLLPRLELLPVEKDDAGHDLAGPRVEARERAVLQYPARPRKILEMDVETLGGLEDVRMGHHVAPVERGALDALEVDGGALPGFGVFLRFVVDLDAAHLGVDALGQDLDGVAHAHATGDEGPRDDAAESLHGEDPVDGNPEQAAVAALADPGGHLLDGGGELRDPLARDNGHRDDRRFHQGRSSS